MKNGTFILGALVFLFGAMWHIPNLKLPFDATTIEVVFLDGSFSLDVIALIVGSLIMSMSWVLHKLVDA